MQFAVAMAKLSFVDPVTGEALWNREKTWRRSAEGEAGHDGGWPLPLPQRIAGRRWATMAKDEWVERLPKKAYEAELVRLQGELVKLQEWVRTEGVRLAVVFEGRDAAGKGSTIKRVSEFLNPRLARIAALPAPTERERTQWYFQRYIQHFPAAGEIVLFDRSWYNRAGVERVMGFCTEEQYRQFLELCPTVERYMVDGGIILIKYWLEVGKQEQQRRFEARIKDPLRQWKLSPMDIGSFNRWDEYSQARDEMLKATDTKHAPWYLVRSDDKRKARLNCISHLLSLIPYKKVPRQKVTLPKRSEKRGYDDQKNIKGRRFVPETY
jgi:polyphosphate kinase